jgi:hypothetical protein
VGFAHRDLDRGSKHVRFRREKELLSRSPWLGLESGTGKCLPSDGKLDRVSGSGCGVRGSYKSKIAQSMVGK